MKHTVRVWRPTGLRIFALALAIAAAPLPALAGEAAATTPAGPGLSASVQKVTATETLKTTPQASASQQGGVSSSDLSSKSFFKTPTGIIALIVAGVGVGAALYSTQNDRVKSPAR